MNSATSLGPDTLQQNVHTRYSYFGPADMTGHDSSLQKSVQVPYTIEAALKKCTARSSGQCKLNRNSGIDERTVNGHPFVKVLAVRQLHRIPHIANAT